MSQRGKRPNQLESGDDPPPPVKRRKGRPPSKGNNAGPSASSSGHNSSGGGSSSSHSGAVKTHDDGAAGCSAMASTSSGAVHSSTASTSASAWQARPLTDVKMSSIYNRSAPEPPAELFRKDLISAMKLPDSEPLAADEYWVITDQWKQEWERGVQVPVSPDSLPEPLVLGKNEEMVTTGRQDFKL